MRQALQDAGRHGRRLYHAGAASFVRPPAIATGPVVSRTSGLFWIVGGVLALPLGLQQPAGPYRLAQALIACGAVVAGVCVVLAGHRLPRWISHCFNLAGTAAVTGLVTLAGGGPVSAAYSVLFIIVPLDSFFFFGWLAAFVYLGWGMGALVVCSAVTHAIPGELALSLAVLELTAAVVVGVLVRAAEAGEVDGATGRPNHRALQRRLRTAVSAAASGATGSRFAVALVEVDGVHEVEETSGHAAADRMLGAVMDAWHPILPSGAVLARYGYDVVGLLLPELDGTTAAAVVEGLGRRLPPGQTVTAGVAPYRPGDTASGLLARADQMTGQARHAGRGRVLTADDSQVGVAQLRAGLERRELQVVFQPIVDLATRTVVGAEALVRWQHPSRGTVSPADFVPVAEASGLIHQLGEHVLRQACTEAATWLRDAGEDGFTVTVNVSGQELARPGYLEQVVSALTDAGLPSSCLVLEVTESSLAADGAAAVECLRALRSLGVGVAVDDFGTGYSSLSRLERLPLDTLKIDRSFVAAMRPDGSAPIVSAIVALASALGLGVVAEGVEDPWQAELLRRIGCQRGQGWLFGRPGPAAVVADGLALRRRREAVAAG